MSTHNLCFLPENSVPSFDTPLFLHNEGQQGRKDMPNPFKSMHQSSDDQRSIFVHRWWVSGSKK